VSAPVRFDVEPLDTWVDGHYFEVDRDRGIDFAQATNDHNEAHLAGTAVSPMFNVVPIYSVLYAAVDRVTPPSYRERGVHAGHDMRFLRPLRAGQSIRARARPIGFHAGRTGTAVTVEIVVTDRDGVLMCEQYATAYIRGAVSAIDAGRRAPDTATDPAGPAIASVPTAPTVRATTRVDGDQTQRYAAASGDAMRLHLDDDLARSMGFRGIIAHGLCTMAMAGVAAVRVCCGDDSASLQRLAVRLAAPVYPGDELTTSFHGPSASNGGPRYDFQMANAAGELVIRDGVVEAR
jgi:acyl dehydratase